MYRKDPFEMNSGIDSEISLEKVEQLMMSRYKALLVLDSLAATHQKHSEDYREELRKRLLKIDNDEQKLGSIFTGQFHAQAIKTEKVQLDLLDDNWSHFLLRLAYSRSDELRKWFLEYEVDLFKFRMATQTGYGLDISKFMEIENLDFEKVEINPEMAQFINSKETKCYKVSWTRVLPLVKTRNVYLRDGWAFVTVENVQDILVDEFKSHLQKQLAKGARHWSNNGLSDEENRLVPIFNFFTTRNSQGYTSSNADGTLTAQNMDEVAEQNYPMCMMSMHKHWRQFHHLKHQARLYYWRFLKQAGMPLEDALEVFRHEGGKRGGDGVKQFEKEFAYNIRHAYGKEGKRADYTGYSCSTIISGNPPGAGDCHGCPYKHKTSDQLAQDLREVGGVTDKKKLHQIIKLASEDKYQIACSIHLQAKHLGKELVDLEDVASGIINPNQFFDKSVAIGKGKIGKTKLDVEKEQQAKLEKVGQSQNSIKVEWSQKVGKTMEDIKDEEFDDMELEDGDNEKQEIPTDKVVVKNEEKSPEKSSEKNPEKSPEKSPEKNLEKSPEKSTENDNEDPDSYDSDEMQLQD